MGSDARYRLLPYELTMIDRDLSAAQRRVAKGFPVVTLTGPRQSGKTTLARHVFSGLPCVSLEDPSELAFAQADLLFETAAPTGQGVQTVKIKSGRTITPDTVRAGQRSASFAGADALTPFLVHGGTEACVRSGVRFIPWRGLASGISRQPPAVGLQR